MQVTLGVIESGALVWKRNRAQHDRKIKIVKKVSSEPQFFFAHSESIFVEVFSTAHQFS